MSKLIDQLDSLVKCALKKGADQAEAFGQQYQSREVWLESNKIKTSKSLPSHGIGLRVIKKTSMGFASVNSLEESSFEEICDKALALASANLPDKFQNIPEPSSLPELKKLSDPKLTKLELNEVIGMANLLLETAHKYDRRVMVDSGGVFVSYGEKAVVNSKELRTFEEGTSITTMIMGMARDKKEVSSFDFEFDGAIELSKIKIERTAKIFAETVVSSLGAKPVQSFKGNVLFSPNAFAETLLAPIVYGVNSQNVQKGMSRLAGKIGKTVASKLFTLSDDPLLEGGLESSAFDREGQPHQKLTLIEEGILKTYLYNSYTARKERKSSTGNASGGYRSLPGIGVTNLIVNPGTATKNELIKDIKEGILITRFSGNTNPINGDFSGTVKGGFFIKNGKLIHPVTNTMIAGNVFEGLSNITGISKELTKVFSNLLPYVTTDGISVTSM